MEETLFDQQGNAVAYIAYNDNSTIYMWNGKPVAYIDSENRVYGFNGKHLGWYEKGIIWNLKGERNGFNKSTLPVYAKFEPYKAYKQYKPYKGYKQYSRYKPHYKLNTSNESLSQFLMSGRNS